MSLRSVITALIAFATIMAGIERPASAQTQSVTVFAAASLKTALDDIAAQWQKETGKKMVYYRFIKGAIKLRPLLEVKGYSASGK